MSLLRRLFGFPVPSAAPPAAPPPPPPAKPAAIVTPALLSMLGWDRPWVWAMALAPACERHGITSRMRVAAFLANVGHETNGGRALVESLNYSAEALQKQWPARFSEIDALRMGRTKDQPADQRAIAERAYGGRYGNGPEGTGDGWRFRGRGLMQLTFRGNYQRFAQMIGKPVDDALLVLLETEKGAADSAAHFWEVAGCNPVADQGDIAAVRKIVNGGTIGMDDVRERFIRAQAALA
jgi:putative chitinase